MTSMPANAFRSSSLQRMTVPSNITSLGQSSFRSTASLVSMDLPATMTSIGDWCYGASAMQSLTVRATTPPTLVNNSSFASMGTFNIYVPAESLDTYKNASGWKSRANNIFAIEV